MTTIYVLFTLMMGTLMPVSVHTTKSECESDIVIQKQLGLMDTSNMTCVKYNKSK